MSYFEDKKIIEVADGVDLGTKRLSTEEGSFDVPEWEWEATKTEEVSSGSEGRNSRGNYVVGKILELLRDLNIRTEEIGFYLQKVVNSYQDTEQIAILNALGLKVKNSLEATEAKNKIRLSHWQKQCENSHSDSE